MRQDVYHYVGLIRLGKRSMKNFSPAVNFYQGVLAIFNLCLDLKYSDKNVALLFYDVTQSMQYPWLGRIVNKHMNIIMCKYNLYLVYIAEYG